MNQERQKSQPKQSHNPKAKSGSQYKQRLFLLGIVIINLCLYGALYLMSRNDGSKGSNAPQLTTGEPLEFKTAFEQAAAVAETWQPDAYLTGANTSWRLAAGDRLTMYRTTWTLNFYSSSARQLRLVDVDQDGAQLGHQQRIDTVPQLVEPDMNLDSDGLILTFLGNGGQDFLSTHPNANIHAQLKADASGTALWYITAIDPIARQSLFVCVDARSRQVVLSENNQGG
jgi:hypothetical protein